MAKPFAGRYRLRLLGICAAIIAITIYLVHHAIFRQSIIIAESQISQSGYFTITTNDDHPNYVSIRVVGWLDSQADIRFLERKSTIGPGTVNSVIQDEWYVNEAVGEYTPRNVTKGHLKIYYVWDKPISRWFAPQ